MSDPRADREAYLDRVAARLRLPEDHAQEVLEELRGHLAESVAGLLDEGLTADQAERESIARLGDPGELAVGIRSARQTRRRLLAAAGSGAVAAVGGVVWGYLFAAALATVAGVSSTIFLSLAMPWLGLSSPGWHAVTEFLSIPFAVFVPAYAAHRLVGTVADRSARPVATLRRPVALAGGALLAVIAIFAVPIDNGQTGVVVLLVIPVGFAAGALLARDGMAPRLRRMPGRWVVALIVTTTAALTVGALATSEINPRHGFIAESDTTMIGRDPIELFGEGWIDRGGTIGTIDPVAVHEVTLMPEPSNLLDGWRDLRLEAWPAAGPRTSEIAPTADHPAMTAQMRRDAFGVYAATLDLGVYREPRWFVFAMTGVAPDGTRYLLGGPDTAVPSRPWTGTVWEYFTAP